MFTVYLSLAPTSYLNAAASGVEVTGTEKPTPSTSQSQDQEVVDQSVICPFASMGTCRYGENCTYLHGDVCDTCGLAVLHPDNEEQRTTHMQVWGVCSNVIYSWICRYI